MAEVVRTDAQVKAREGETRTGALTNPTENDDPWLAVYGRQLNRLEDLAALLTSLEVYKDGDLTYGVRAGTYSAGGAKVTYAGSTGNALTDNDTNYIYLTAAGVLGINTFSFPTSARIQLATIVTAAGVYAIDDDLVDFRQSALWSLQSESALQAFPITMSELRDDAWDVLTSSIGVGTFTLIADGWGAGTLLIVSEAASANVKTDTLWFEFTMPANYDASDDVKFSIAAYENAEAAVDSTISAEVYRSDGEGGVGADLAGAWDEDDITTSWGTKVLTITDATLAPGDTIRVAVRVVIDDTGGGGGQVALDSPRMLVTVMQGF